MEARQICGASGIQTSVCFVRTAHAKGLTQTRVLLVHVLRNAIVPIITFLGPTVVELFTGLFIVESLYSFPGLGRYNWGRSGETRAPVLPSALVPSHPAICLPAAPPWVAASSSPSVISQKAPRRVGDVVVMRVVSRVRSRFVAHSCNTVIVLPQDAA